MRRGAAVVATALLVSACGGGGTTTTSSSGSDRGPRPAAARLLASSTWQGMRITVRAAAPAPFVIFNGTSETTVRTTPRDSFQLTVTLTDAQSGVAIPYATVSATIRKGGTVVYDQRQWPMLTAVGNPLYANNVSLPGAGAYQLTLVVTPPVSARHLEYQHVWLKPHRASFTFHWKAPT